MVSKAKSSNYQLPRDEHVTRGIVAESVGKHAPFMYDLYWKSGRGRTRRDKVAAKNRVSLFGKMIENHAEEGKDFFVWNVSRAMKFQAKARDL